MQHVTSFPPSHPHLSFPFIFVAAFEFSVINFVIFVCLFFFFFWTPSGIKNNGIEKSK